MYAVVHALLYLLTSFLLLLHKIKHKNQCQLINAIILHSDIAVFRVDKRVKKRKKREETI